MVGMKPPISVPIRLNYTAADKNLMRGRCATILRMPGHRLCNHWRTPWSENPDLDYPSYGWFDLDHPTAAFVEAQSLLF
jgi:hypothetical protein